jgi:ABC-type glycerol-3-phosphate transport system substrate-binding protein
MATKRALPRRTLLQGAAGAAALPLVHVRTAGAAGRLSGATWNHFIPGYREALLKLVTLWGEKNKVEVQLDFISYNAILMSEAEEALTRSGHDFRSLNGYPWDPHVYADQLESMDDVMARLIAKYGALAPLVEHLGKVEGSWMGVPGSSVTYAVPCCTRMDIFKQQVGMDVQSVFPAANSVGPGYDQWTWDQLLIVAERCAKSGTPLGLSMGQVQDASAWLGALFRGFGAELVDAKGNVTVRSDNVRKVLDYMSRLMRFVPDEVYSWDNVSDNRALIAGRVAMLFDPPSPWAVAVRDNPKVGEQIWHHPMPAGEHGRFAPYLCSFWGLWNFSQNKSAAKDLIEWLAEREQVETICNASWGYETPAFISMTDFPVWAEAGPPKGTLFNYPIKPHHHIEPTVAGWPAPPAVAAQIMAQSVMPKLISRVTQSGMPIEQSITLAEQELAGFTR